MMKIAAINRTFPEQEFVRNGNSLAFVPQGRGKTPDNTRAIGPRQSGYLQVLQDLNPSYLTFYSSTRTTDFQSIKIHFILALQVVEAVSRNETFSNYLFLI